MHERKTNWINYEVHLIDLNFFVDEISKIISTVPNKQVQTLEQRKMEVLKKIQEKFITDNNDSLAPEDLEGSLGQPRKGENSTISKFIQSFNPGDNSRYTNTENRVEQDMTEGLRRQRKVFPDKINSNSQA